MRSSFRLFRRFLPRERITLARLERRQAVIRLIREESDIECPLQLVGLPVLAYSGTELPMVYARRPSHDIPDVSVEIRVRISPHRLDAFDVGTGETIALHVETQLLHQVTLIARSYHTCCGCLGSIV